MRTKTLLLSAVALLAAGVVSTQAQPVYSQNIVGYVTQTLPYNGSLNNSHGWANVCTPLDLGAGNSLTNLFPNYGLGAGNNVLDGDLVYIWNGHGYTEYTMDSSYASGVGDFGDNDTIEPYAPIVNPGALVFILNNGYNQSVSGVSVTNSLSGTVHVDTLASGSQTVGQTTNVLIKGLNYVASKLPVGGGLNSVLQLSLAPNGGFGGANSGTNQLDYSLVYVPNIVNGNFAGYTEYTVDSTYTTGFGDFGDNPIASEPTVPAGVGIIVDYLDANSGNDPEGADSTYYWIQAY
jgi:hypothetical protein